MPVNAAEPLVAVESAGPPGERMVVEQILVDALHAGAVGGHQCAERRVGGQLVEHLANLALVADPGAEMHSTERVFFDQQAVAVRDQLAQQPAAPHVAGGKIVALVEARQITFGVKQVAVLVLAIHGAVA